jgi:hypothetical protein
VAPAEAFQVSVGVRVVTVVPGDEDPPGDRPVGVAGTVVTFTVMLAVSVLPLYVAVTVTAVVADIPPLL